MIYLYRAVTQAELEDIRSLGGRFRDSTHQTGEKGFFFDVSSAQEFAANMSAIVLMAHFVVRTEAPNELVSTGREHRALGEGPGVYLRIADLVVLSPAEELTF